MALLAGLALVAVAGCEPEPTQSTAVEPPPRERTPEDRFEAIVETLKHGLENQSISSQSLAVDGAPGPGDPVAAARIQVEHELLPPEEEGEPYRARVTFVSDSKVTVVLPKPQKGDDEATKKKNQEEQSVADLDIEGLDLDQLKVPTQDAVAEKMGTSPIHELQSEDEERTFEMILRDGRWALVNEPDPATEPYYDLVLKRAIRNQ